LDKDELSLFWKWVVLIEISKMVIKSCPLKSKIPFTPAYKLKKFIRGKYDNNMFELIDYSETKSMKNSNSYKSGINKYDIEFSEQNGEENTSQINKHFKPKEYFGLVDSLTKRVFRCLNSKKQYTLIYDDLDELEGKIEEDKFYIKLILAMIESVRELNFDIRKKTKNNSKVIVLLRDDIIDSLQQYSTNLNKLISESEVQLYWLNSSCDSLKHPLMELVLNKIQKSQVKFSTYSTKTVYGILFPKKVENKDVIRYLLDYSFGRPRDIIRYLNIIKERYPDANAFEPEHFKACKQEYSNWFYNELINELSIHENPSFVCQSLELIKNLKKRVFTYDEIKEYYAGNIELFPEIKNLKDAIKCMYKFGVIGNSWSVLGGYRYSWGYRKDADSNPDYTKTFTVHYGLRKKFSL